MRITALTLFVALLGLASNSCSAQSSSSSAETATSTSSSAVASSTLIPTGLSDSCTSFLNTLNTDATIKECTHPLLAATNYYANATEAAKNKKSSSSSVSSSASALEASLGQLCDSQTGCQPGVIRTQLAQFWNNCGAELKAKNAQVIAVYDVLYLINPFHEAVCTRDDSNNYCVLSIANNTATQEASSSSTSSKRSLGLEHSDLLHHGHRHHRRQDDSATETAQEIDSGSLTNANIAFLFLQPNSSKSLLCSSCSKNILASYIQFETSIPYAIGLSNSETLSGQSALYKGMVETCGTDFTTSVNAKAGTTAFAEVGAAIGFAPARIGLALGAATVLAGLLLA